MSILVFNEGLQCHILNYTIVDNCSIIFCVFLVIGKAKKVRVQRSRIDTISTTPDQGFQRGK